ncbi:MAG: peptidoglycan DD-metalloendopeptidase family protein [Pseudomonadota bacterium]|nr:peptidoglycan DD-metalloendopeptidase family protein [Pseudomonadota bacterium]
MPDRRVILNYAPRLQWQGRSGPSSRVGTAHRLDWGLSDQRERQPHRWLFLSSLALVILLLAGMGSHEVSNLDRLLSAAPQGPDLRVAHRKAPIPLKWPVALDGTERLRSHPMQVAARISPRRSQRQSVWQEIKVRRGDSLALIFDRLGLGKGQLDQVLSPGRETAGLKRLRPGQTLRILIRDGELAEMRCEQDATRTLHVSRGAHGRFRVDTIIRKPQVRVATTTASIGSSLFQAGQSAGLSDPLIMRLMQIFRWDIDFALDIRKGDRFAVIYEELWRDGKTIKQGEILAAEFKSRGKSYRAVRFVDAQGRAEYYSQWGDALDKAFIRTPVQFSRISSHFSLRRRHPILHTLRAHKGVDYAAPHGTPVKATGNGKVQFAGTQNGYGKTIILQHGDRYGTLYAHLCRFAPRITAGQSVRQGQIIGYVGSTGFATGPHLHYEFRIDGVHRDPLTVGLPRALPLSQIDQRRFRIKARFLLAQLDSLASTPDDPSDRRASRRKGITTLARHSP